MEDYQRIREIELERTKDYSNRKFNWYFREHKLLRFLYSELFFWSISLLSMLIFPILIGGSLKMYILFFFAHFLFWFIKGESMYHKDCDEDLELIDTTIKVLQELKQERNLTK